MKTTNFVNVMKTDIQGFDTASKLMFGIVEPAAIFGIFLFIFKDALFFNDSFKDANQLAALGLILAAALLCMSFNVYRIYKAKKLILIEKQ